MTDEPTVLSSGNYWLHYDRGRKQCVFCNTPKNCKKCWLDWLRAECDRPTTAFYDVVEEHHGCMVQVLKNSVTGEISVGWKEERDEPPKAND